MAHLQLNQAQRWALDARGKFAEGVFRVGAHLPDKVLLASLRGLLGRHRYPEGQLFLEKGAVALKRVLRHSNPASRKKIVENLVINECVKGQAMRRHVSGCLGMELPVLVVVSPTMRCPLRCYGCYAAQYARDSDLDPVVFDRLITEAKSLGIHFFVISGGEPFIYPHIHELFHKHSDVWFQVYTSGITLSPAGARQLARLGNVMPCISVEGFEEEVDRRRGKGHFGKVMEAFANLRNEGVPFGFSATATRENNDLVVSDKFVDFYAGQGAALGWYFQYMPIGREPNLDLVPTPQQRIYRFHRLADLRKQHDIVLSDFWNDGPLVGGCIAARRYLHVNHSGAVEPCVFCQFSVDNLYEKGLLEILQTSPLFAAIRKQQPYNDNYLKPCMIIDNPEVLKKVIEETGATETCGLGAPRLVRDLYPRLQEYAKEYGVLAERLWASRFEKSYDKTLAEAHELRQRYLRREDACAKCARSAEECRAQEPREKESQPVHAA